MILRILTIYSITISGEGVIPGIILVSYWLSSCGMALGHCPSPWLRYVQKVFDIGTVWHFPRYQDSAVSIFNVADFFYSLAPCKSLKQWYVSMPDKGIDVNEKEIYFFNQKFWSILK